MILLLLLSLSLLLLLLLIIFWMPVFWVLIYSVSEIPTQSTKKGRFKDRHSCSHEQVRMSSSPVRNFKLCASKTFWDHKWMQTLRKVKTFQCITASKIIAGSVARIPLKGKNGWETPEKHQRIVLQRLVKQRSFKNQEITKRKWGAGNDCWKWEVSGLNRRVGISGVFSLRRTVWVKCPVSNKELLLNTNINGTFIQG